MAIKPRVAIIGSGSWATALAKLLLNNLDTINWYQRKQEDVDYFKEFGNNPRYLTSVEFNIQKINFYTSLPECVKNSDYFILAVPSAFLHDTLSVLNKEDLKDKRLFIMPSKRLLVLHKHVKSYA